MGLIGPSGESIFLKEKSGVGSHLIWSIDWDSVGHEDVEPTVCQLRSEKDIASGNRGTLLNGSPTSVQSGGVAHQSRNVPTDGPRPRFWVLFLHFSNPSILVFSFLLILRIILFDSLISSPLTGIVHYRRPIDIPY